MANFSEIGDVIQAINWTFLELNVENIVPVSIQSSNEASNGWAGLLVFIILCLGTFFHINKNKNSFNIFDKFNLLFVSLNIFLDIGIYLLIFGILESLQIFIFLFVIYFIFLVASLLRKEILGAES